MGVASLVLGIIALVCCFIPGASIVGLVLSVIGVALGAVGKKKEVPCAVGGLVCSIIALVFCGIFFFACGGFAACASCAAVM